MRSHARIRIKFEVKGRCFEAVGFLHKKDGGEVDSDTMLSRVSKVRGGAISDDDEEFLLQHSDRIPEELRDYWLVTNWHRGRNGQSDYVSYLHCYRGSRSYIHGWSLEKPAWRQQQGDHDFGWDYRYLVVRRCP